MLLMLYVEKRIYFERLYLPKSLRPRDLFVLLARVRGPQEGEPREGAVQPGVGDCAASGSAKARGPAHPPSASSPVKWCLARHNGLYHNSQ